MRIAVVVGWFLGCEREARKATAFMGRFFYEETREWDGGGQRKGGTRPPSLLSLKAMVADIPNSCVVHMQVFSCLSCLYAVL